MRPELPAAMNLAVCACGRAAHAASHCSEQHVSCHTRQGGPGFQRSGAAIMGMYAHRCSARGKAFNSCESLGLGYGCHTSWITYHPAFMLCVPMARSQVPFLRYMLSTIFCGVGLAQILTSQPSCNRVFGSLASFPLRLMPSPAKSKGIYTYIFSGTRSRSGLHCISIYTLAL